jgi:type I restriction enzyme M protein
LHTLLRLPTGIFYAQGVKANVLFFDRRVASEKPWTKKLWIYDFRTNEHFTLKTNPLRRENLDEFVACYHAENRHKRKETDRFHAFAYDDLVKRDKASLDLFWLKDDSLEDAANFPAPDVIAAEIVEDLQAALEEFALIAEDLRKGSKTPLRASSPTAAGTTFSSDCTNSIWRTNISCSSRPSSVSGRSA